MAFIKIAYCCTAPFLMLLIFINKKWKKNLVNLLAASNILLIGNSVFLSWQLISAYQMMKSFAASDNSYSTQDKELFIRIILIVLLPFLSMFRYFRKSSILSVIMIGLLYSVFPFSSWNLYGLFIKIPYYACLLCSAYALLWLLNQLPYQSRSI